jgi:transcriptional regulator with XRE-family HTH domain
MDLFKTGLFISSMRKQKGITQKELAEKIGVTDKAVSRWETGKGLPDIPFLIPLAEIFGVSVTEIIRGERMATEDKGTLVQMDKEQIKKMKPLRPLLDNLSLLGYVLIAAASSGYYELALLNRGAPFIVWIALALAGGVCLALRNREYYKQHGSVPSLITDIVFVLAVLLIPKIPLQDTYSVAGYSIRIMQVLAILFIPIYIYTLSPWRGNKKNNGEGGAVISVDCKVKRMSRK